MLAVILNYLLKIILLYSRAFSFYKILRDAQEKQLINIPRGKGPVGLYTQNLFSISILRYEIKIKHFHM